MSLIVVDVEADGPCPGPYSMVSFGAVVVDENLDKTFFGQVRPISNNFKQSALNYIKVSREEHLTYEDPILVIKRFEEWLQRNSKGQPVFLSDNNGFDWQFINYYFCCYNNEVNPFGHSSRRIGDLYSGLRNKMKASSEWKRLRKTKHTHNPVDDVKGNAEALLSFSRKFGLVLPHEMP